MIPVRQLQIPNLLNIDITENMVFSENTNVQIEYEFDEDLMCILSKELHDSNSIKYYNLKYSPLSRIRDTINSKIIDSIENNLFTIDSNYITINGTSVIINCNLKLFNKYK